MENELISETLSSVETVREFTQGTLRFRTVDGHENMVATVAALAAEGYQIKGVTESRKFVIEAYKPSPA